MMRLMMVGCVTEAVGNLNSSIVRNAYAHLSFAAMADIEKASHIVLIAADPYVRQPILNLRIKKAMKSGAHIYVINESETELDRFAVSKITIPQNGAGIAAKMLLKHMLNDEIANSHQYEEMRAKIQGEDEAIHVAEENFGVQATTQLQHLAETLAGSKGAIILYDEMATLAPGCTDLAVDLQALAVLTDNVTRTGSGVGPLVEDANSLGARDMGLLPDALPGYDPIAEKGLAYDEMLSSPDIKALYVMGANPSRHVKQLPSNLEFLLVQDIILTETAEQADVVLPA